MTIPSLTLWELTPLGGSVVRLCSSPPVRLQQTPFPNRAIWVGGNPYYCAGIEATGIERTIGQVTPVRLNIAFTEYIRARKDVLFVPDTLVVRYETDALAADVVNWADSTNPYGIPSRTNQRIDRWIITRTLQENNTMISVEMQSESNFWRDVIRPNVQGRCYHKYRGADCGYTGTNYFDADGNSVDAAGDDVCGLSIKDCELRFPTGALPYGGLPTVEKTQ